MKNILSITLIASTTALMMIGCSSTTIISSTPEGAKLYLNEEYMGTTPYSYTDTKIVGAQNTVRLEKDGYQVLKTSFKRNEEVCVGAIIGGCFFLVPFFWTMEYKPYHDYELTPLRAPESVSTPIETVKKSSIERLKELKEMLDQNLITQEEYDAAKEKILNLD